jgi:uncharacterized membrane protein
LGLARSFGSPILIGSQPKNGLDLLVNLFIFGFSFMIVVLTWVGYTRTIAVLPSEAPFAFVLNLGLLFCVALEPYLFYLLVTTQLTQLADPASIVYAVDARLMFLCLAGLARIVVAQEKIVAAEDRLPPSIVNRLNRVMKVETIVGGICLTSSLPFFWTSTPIGMLRFPMWSSSFLRMFALRRRKPPTPNAK